MKTFLRKKRQTNNYYKYEITRQSIRTFVFEFSSLVITVKTGIFFSLSDKQSGNGRNRRFSLRSSSVFGVTVERVLSNKLINCSECESYASKRNVQLFFSHSNQHEPMMIEIVFALDDKRVYF